MANKKTEINTLTKAATWGDEFSSSDDTVSFAEDPVVGDGLEDNVFYAEDQDGATIGEFVEELLEGEGGIDEMEEVLDSIEEDLEELDADFGGELLAGSEFREGDFDDDDSTADTDYANDGDLSKFMDYVSESYPSKIPQHDGSSVLGCERAVSFLDRLNSEISRAIRDDSDSVIDIGSLEGVRLNIMKDIIVLKNHVGKLKKKFKDQHKKDASSAGEPPPSWTTKTGDEVEYNELKKEATTPRNMVIAISPFERAITGMMINAHVSGGNDMEEVYGFLSKKYDISPREELSIMQVLADSGFHIFKDRGTYAGKGSDKETGNRGVDFIKNYFA
jgi:hypothetical protein